MDVNEVLVIEIVRDGTTVEWEVFYDGGRRLGIGQVDTLEEAFAAARLAAGVPVEETKP